MSETFISDIITNIIAAAIALATGSVEGEGEETAEPAQEPTQQVRTIRAYEIKCRSHAEKKQMPLRRICHLKMSYLTIGRRICHLKMSYLTIGRPPAQNLPNILRLPRPRVRLRWTSTRATMNMLSANASAMRCVVNGVKMTMMRDVARRGHGHMWP